MWVLLWPSSHGDREGIASSVCSMNKHLSVFSHTTLQHFKTLQKGISLLNSVLNWVELKKAWKLLMFAQSRAGFGESWVSSSCELLLNRHDMKQSWFILEQRAFLFVQGCSWQRNISLLSDQFIFDQSLKEFLMWSRQVWTAIVSFNSQFPKSKAPIFNQRLSRSIWILKKSFLKFNFNPLLLVPSGLFTMMMQFLAQIKNPEWFSRT